MPNYPREQLLDLYKALPKELQTAIFSADNADKVLDICQRNGLTEDKIISEIARNTGYVLLGILPPEELQRVLEKEIGLKKSTAKQIAWEINRFIFFPVRPFLEALYQTDLMKISGGAKAPIERQETEKTAKKDRYREPIE